jgi:hypothetical protein
LQEHKKVFIPERTQPIQMSLYGLGKFLFQIRISFPDIQRVAIIRNRLQLLHTGLIGAGSIGY